MEEQNNNLKCFLCEKEALYCQHLTGLDKKQRVKGTFKPMTFTVVSCEECKELLEKGAIQQNKLMVTVALVWLGIFVLMFCFIHFFTVLLLFTILGIPALCVMFFISNWLFAPKIIKRAKAYIQDSALQDGIVISDFNSAWLKLGTETEDRETCSNCGEVAPSHLFGLRGSTHLHTEGLFEKRAHYAENKALFPLCYICADSLKQNLIFSLALKLLFSVSVGSVLTYALIRYNERPGTPIFISENLPYLMAFALCFGLAYGLMIPVTLFLFETRWLKKTKIFSTLKAQGFGNEVICVNKWPFRKKEP